MFERIMGLNVVDDESYKKYRDAMTPILNSYQSDFGYDFVISRTLKSKTKNKINRLFTIDFSSEKIMNDFFQDPKYLAIKEKYLDNSIDGKTIISMHEKN